MVQSKRTADTGVLWERERSLKTSRLLFHLAILIVLLLALRLTVALSYSQVGGQKIAYIQDTIEPSLDGVKWSEEGGIEVTPTWISDGMWNAVSIQQSLVDPGDIFVSWYESFNWSLVNYYYGLPFAFVEDFGNNLTASPLWWLNSMWKIDPDWSGISANTSKVMFDFNYTTSTFELSMWFHITRIPEYFVGHGGLQSWLAGFDLTSVSTGALTAWEFHEDWNKIGLHYNLYFKAPAHLLIQHEDNYTFSIGVQSLYVDRAFNTSQTINVNMPADTEIKETSPSSMAVQKSNTASFVKAPEDTYPQVFAVVSGPRAKSLSQIIADDASLWFFTPGGWAAIASLLVLSYTGLRGRRILNRNNLYHRLYKGMVSVYDMYPKDLLKFHQEMDNISRAIIKLLVEDKINDEQFEKLLKRRDDLMTRVQQ
jgi:hypothetical protein